MEQEVQCAEVWKLEANDVPVDHSPEVLRDTVPGDMLVEQRIPPSIDGDEADVGGVSLVAGPRVGNVDEAYFHEMISTAVVTTRLSTSAGQ